MLHYCFSCGQQRKLNALAMCAPCVTKWYDSAPDQRRALLHAVPAQPRPEMSP